MKLSFHIAFADGSNPWYSSLRESSETIKEVKRWYKNHYKDRFDIWTENHDYRISNTTWRTWVVYRKGKWIDNIISKQYRNLGNAVKFLEKLLDTASQTC